MPLQRAAVRPSLGGLVTVHAHGNTGATETIDLANGNYHSATLDANCTFTFTGATNGKECAFTLVLTQDATGSRTVTWPAAVTWPGASAPTLATAASAVDVLVFWTVDGGTLWFGNHVTATASGSITSSGYTQSTARLLGRTTASTGAIEEITVGSGLSLSAGSLTATGSGSSGFIDYDRIVRTAGSYTLNSTSYADIDTGLDLTLTAASGDIVEVTLNGVYGSESVNGFIDVATVVAGSPVNYFGAATTGDGILGWAKFAGAVTFPFGSSMSRTLVAGDVSAGTVKLRLRYKTNTAANLTLFGTSGDPLTFEAKVFRL